MTAKTSDTARAWVDVDLGALAANYRTLRERANPRVGMLPVVKADAYGLGVGPVLQVLEDLGPWGYAVAALTEGIDLRSRGIERPIVLLFCTPEELDGASAARLSPAIGDLEALGRWREIARRADRRLPFHLEIDTGMGRAGFPHDRTEGWLPGVLEATDAELDWEGTFTHFHSPESEDEAPTREQWGRWQACQERLPADVGGLRHIASSAAALRWPGYAADLVRPGIFLYGARVVEGEPTPRPVATVRARAVAVRQVPEGWTASYGATFRAPVPSRWATLAIGYGDGLRRELSNRGTVRFAEGGAPIVGRVCMDVTVADVTDFQAVRAGDVAVVIGGRPDDPTSLETVAAHCGTIPYEILTGLTARLPRRYSGGGDAEGAGTASSPESARRRPDGSEAV
jgi:alanine racemase